MEIKIEKAIEIEKPSWINEDKLIEVFKINMPTDCTITSINYAILHEKVAVVIVYNGRFGYYFFEERLTSIFKNEIRDFTINDIIK